MRTGSGEAAFGLAFARDTPDRAVVRIAVDGLVQAHSWDLRAGTVVTATNSRIGESLISPDGEWVWWFDLPSGRWWRTPFGSSPRGRRDLPLRLAPAPEVALALGGDGTAVVARPGVGAGTAWTISLLPVGRVRPGAEPVFLGGFDLRALHRSRDDALLAVREGAGVRVLAAHSGAPVAAEALAPGWTSCGFTADSALLLFSPTQARLWNPRTGLHQRLALSDSDELDLVGAVVDYAGTGALLEVREAGGIGVYARGFDGALPRRIGPPEGTITPGTTAGGPSGQVFALWSPPDEPARLVDLTAVAGDPRGRPAVGGYGS